MRLAYVCTDRDLVVPGPGRGSREVLANLKALEAAGHDVSFFGIGEGARVPGSWRVVRQRAGNGPKEFRDHYSGTALAPTAAEVWSLSVNHRLGRTLEEERQRAPLDCVVERLSAWSYAAAAFCHQRRVPYVVEIASRPLWERWQAWDAQLESAAQAVHAFSISLASLVIVRDEQLAVHYRSLTSAPVVALKRRSGEVPGRRPGWARGFVLVHAGSPSPFEDLKTIVTAAAGLPDGFSFRRVAEPGDLAWANAGVVPATVGAAVDVGPYLAANLPLVIPKGSAAAKLPLRVARTLYAPGDAASLRAAMVGIKDEIATLPKPRHEPYPTQFAAFLTKSLTRRKG